MGYVDNNLLPDEQILFRTKKNFIIYMGPMIWTIATIVMLCNQEPYINKVGLVFGLLALFSWGMQLLQYVTSDFAVTTRRVIMREGFFIRHVNEARLSTVSNISVNQSLLGQLFNFGTVIVHTFGGDADAFTEISRPNEFKNRLQEQLEKIVK